MTYIVYIPDMARGEAAYTQRSFGSLKDLARWAMDAALEAPAPTDPLKPTMVTPTIIASLSETEKVAILSALGVTPVAPDVKQLLDTKPSDLRSMSELKDVVTDSITLSTTTVDEDTFTVDTSAWFTEESAFSKALDKRDWKVCAQIAFRGICNNVLVYADSPSDTLAEEDVKLFLNTAIQHLPTLVEDIMPELAGVSWNLLPRKFQKALEKQITCEDRNPLGVSKRKAAHPVTMNFFQIINFFREGRRHQSWKPETVMFREMELYKAPTHQIALSLIGDWWAGGKTTDEIRAFMIKLTVLRFFVNANTSATVGSSEFLDQFFKYVMKLDLPAEFVAWATKGTTHRHCRKALGELNVVQARRAEGQRFIGLEEYKEKPITDEHPWCYDFEYNTLYTSLLESELIPGEGAFPFASLNSDSIQLLAPY